MRIGFFGDVVGRTGRDAVSTYLPSIRARLKLDFVIINAENAAGGFGISEKTAKVLFDAGADCLTLGNHAWDQRDALTYIAREARLLRPVNYPESSPVPGRGANLFVLDDGRRVGVINLLGRLFMDSLDDPFSAVDNALYAMPLQTAVDALIVDFHAEATSEKMAMGHFCDGRASLIVGTHTHIPTADAQILPGGSAYQTDSGMCGDYDSVIGMKKGPAVQRFATRLPSERLTPAGGEASLCGVYVETDNQSGLAKYVAPIRVGGRLIAYEPDL